MKKFAFLSVLLAAAGIWATGCGSSTVSCDQTVATFHYCYEYTDLDSTQTDAAKAGCSAGKWAEAACSTADSLGTCSMTGGGVTFSAIYYTATGVTADSAKTSCEGVGGTWTAK
jgi:hypothetical protein